MVKKMPGRAGDMGSISGPGRSHMPQGSETCVPQLLSLCALEPVFQNRRSQHNEKPVHCNEDPACSQIYINNKKEN